jgi:hypothetical protein
MTDARLYLFCCAAATGVGGVILLGSMGGICGPTGIRALLCWPLFLSMEVLGDLGILAHLAIGALAGYGLPWGTVAWALVRRTRFKELNP